MWQAYLDGSLLAPWVDAGWVWVEPLKSWWHSIESALLLLGLWWLSHRLKRERKKIEGVVDQLGERVETFGQFAKAARDAAETAVASEPTAGAAPGNGLSHWEALRSEWLEIRDRIELAIERIPKKQRGKYAKINRYSYLDVIVALGQDDAIRPAVVAALIQMNQRFLGLRSRPSNTMQADVEQFRALKQQVNGSLPKLPKPKSPPDSATGSLPAAAE